MFKTSFFRNFDPNLFDKTSCFKLQLFLLSENWVNTSLFFQVSGMHITVPQTRFNLRQSNLFIICFWTCQIVAFHMHWGSEYRTRQVIKWPKTVQSSNGVPFEWFPKSRKTTGSWMLSCVVDVNFDPIWCSDLVVEGLVKLECKFVIK